MSMRELKAECSRLGIDLTDCFDKSSIVRKLEEDEFRRNNEVEEPPVVDLISKYLSNTRPRTEEPIQEPPDEQVIDQVEDQNDMRDDHQPAETAEKKLSEK